MGNYWVCATLVSGIARVEQSKGKSHQIIIGGHPLWSCLFHIGLTKIILFIFAV